MNYGDYGLFIKGGWKAPVQGGTYDVINPSDEEVIGQAAQATAADVAEAIDGAAAGLADWRAISPWDRSNVLRKIADLLRQRTTTIAEQISLEIGKPVAQAKGEVAGSAEQFDWFADETRRLYGQIIESRLPNSRHYVHYEPIGIAAAFTPWNFPVALAARKIAPALAAGCAVICRGAQEAPGAAMLLVECCADAGVPAGAISLLNGEPEPITDAIMADPRVRKISFTGSVRVGKILAAAAAQTLKRVTMELGGHAPVIVLEDVDVDAVARLSAASKFRNGGQVCISPSRFFVMESIAERYAQVFAEATQSIRLGVGLEAGVDMGPLATAARRDAVSALVEDALACGSQLLAGGGRPSDFNRGYFYSPTVLNNVPSSARVMSEEPFGPIAPISPVASLEEALEKANAVEFGLNGYAFTNSLRDANAIVEGLQTGMVTINSYAPAMTEVPFGGIKASGYGREGGDLGIREYLESKSVTLTYA